MDFGGEMAEIVDFDGIRAEAYVEGVFRGFLIDPADSDYQRGYLQAMIDLYRECLRRGVGDDRLKLLDTQVRAQGD